jgi:hypothetical protein
MFAKSEAITGGTWDVDISNVWGDDYVGWFGTAVSYYRLQGRAPCGTRFPQRMVIDCSTGNTTYIMANELAMSFDDTSVTSTRAGQTVSRSWLSWPSPWIGDWAGSATVTDDQHQETVSASASISLDQATNSILATIVFTGPGDVPEIGTATLQMAPPNFSFSSTTDSDPIVNAPGTVRIDSNGVTISGRDQGVPESWSGTLTFTSGEPPISAYGSGTFPGGNWQGTLTFSPDGMHLSGSATTTSGFSLTWTADKQ